MVDDERGTMAGSRQQGQQQQRLTFFLSSFRQSNSHFPYLFCFGFGFHRTETTFLYGNSQCSTKMLGAPLNPDAIFVEPLMASGSSITPCHSLRITNGIRNSSYSRRHSRLHAGSVRNLYLT